MVLVVLSKSLGLWPLRTFLKIYSGDRLSFQTQACSMPRSKLCPATVAAPKSLVWGIGARAAGRPLGTLLKSPGSGARGNSLANDKAPTEGPRNFLVSCLPTAAVMRPRGRWGSNRTQLGASSEVVCGQLPGRRAQITWLSFPVTGGLDYLPGQGDLGLRGSGSRPQRTGDWAQMGRAAGRGGGHERLDRGAPQ